MIYEDKNFAPITNGEPEVPPAKGPGTEDDEGDGGDEGDEGESLE